MTDNNALAQELGPYRLTVERSENFGGEHRSWHEEITIPRGHKIIQTILTDAALRTPAPAPVGGDVVERAVMVCPQCEGEGRYADGLDEAACSTDCTRCGGNGWIVDRAALQAQPAPASDEVREMAERLRRLHTRHSIGGTALEEAADMLERLASQPLADCSTKETCK